MSLLEDMKCNFYVIHNILVLHIGHIFNLNLRYSENFVINFLIEQRIVFEIETLT